MTFVNESVETVEAMWKVPDFQKLIHTDDETPFVLISRHGFFIGGRVPPGDPQLNSPPVKLQADLWQLNSSAGERKLEVRLSVADPSRLPLQCSLRGKLVEFTTFGKEKATLRKVFKRNGTDTFQTFLRKSVIDFYAADCHLNLFDVEEVVDYVDKSDGCLKIYFKLEITFSMGKPIGGDLSGLSTDFESLLNDNTSGDVEIKILLGKGRSFFCHKVILGVRSEVFQKMFGSEMKESVVEVDDILPKTMKHFLSFLYCGRFPDSSWVELIPQLAYASDKYCVKSLKNLCDSNLIRIVTARNALRMGIVAERHGLTKALKDIEVFIADAAEELSLETKQDIETQMTNCDVNFKVKYGVPVKVEETG